MPLAIVKMHWLLSWAIFHRTTSLIPLQNLETWVRIPTPKPYIYIVYVLHVIYNKSKCPFGKKWVLFSMHTLLQSFIMHLLVYELWASGGNSLLTFFSFIQLVFLNLSCTIVINCTLVIPLAFGVTALFLQLIYQICFALVICGETPLMILIGWLSS